MRIKHKHINSAKLLGLLVPILEKHNAPANIFQIVSPSRAVDLIYARALIAHILRHNKFSFSQIGYVLNRDHSTAIHLMSYANRKNAPKNIMGMQDYYFSIFRDAKEKLKEVTIDKSKI